MRPPGPAALTLRRTFRQAGGEIGLVVLGLGKLAMVLGGSGQGQPTAGAPATAYLGPGPWGSLAPAIPSIPSQAIEGFATVALVVVLLLLLLLPAFRRGDGRAFLVALAGWAAVRLAVASTWRDPVVIGPFRAEQLIDLAVLIGSIVLLGVVAARSPAEAPSPSSALAAPGE